MTPSEKTSAGVLHASPAIRSGGLYGRRTGARRPEAVERIDDAEAGRARLVWRDENVARDAARHARRPPRGQNRAPRPAA